ncbi:hypothetical protein Tsubulata_034808 [Turnera subulata]|uniref:Uncharacterized protein n=1 Tax=Turnera subulata TaxID=218843 RepID=A0A9Q0GFJ8_9ROSI|nr:hypothetical protein Tsubulata_034808 [Turnera subulata]
MFALFHIKKAGGRLVCIISHQEGHQKKNTKAHSPDDLEDVIEVVYGNAPEVMIKQYKNIDFAVIDGKLEFHPKFLERNSVNPRGSIIVRHNLHCREHEVMSVGDYVCNAMKGVECATLPTGGRNGAHKNWTLSGTTGGVQDTTRDFI